MNTIEMKANAKINLALDIKGKRSDGYHEVEMIMQSISLADEVSVTRTGTGGIIVTCDNPELPQDTGNTAYRAAEGFFTFNHMDNPGLTIKIIKHIPAQAGLAGGSADAAAVLIGLDALFNTHSDHRLLKKIALLIGADVPFCLYGGTMFARGIGEQLTRLPHLPDCIIVIVKPSESVSTPAAYSAYDRLGYIASRNIRTVCEDLETGSIRNVARGIFNVLEEAAGLPVIARIKAGLLEYGALGACMSGSGSAVFGLFDDAVKAQLCRDALKNSYREVFLCFPEQIGCAVIKSF